MFKTMLAEVRDSFNADYARQILLDKRDLPFRERMRLVRETREYQSRAHTARIRGTWVLIVGLTPLLVPGLPAAQAELRHIDVDRAFVGNAAEDAGVAVGGAAVMERGELLDGGDAVAARGEGCGDAAAGDAEA